jgi:uncharacterized membrane protein YdbT with pleckstrin-like domain
MNGWRGAVCTLFRVPPKPSPPPGTGVRTFRASRNFLRLKLIGWGISLIFLLIPALGLTAVAAGHLSVDDPDAAAYVIVPLAALMWGLFAFRLLLGYGLVLLDYEMRWYIVSDRAIRIREGILKVREKTITFANIQNVTVKQGPLERLLGIANVEVRTAGGGSSTSGKKGEQHSAEEPMHVGMFRGVDNAQLIRDLVLTSVRRQKDSGLGDPDDAAHDESDSSDLDAARALVDECRALRRAAVSAGHRLAME